MDWPVLTRPSVAGSHAPNDIGAPTPAPPALNRERDMTALVSEFAGIVQQIAHHLRQANAVAINIHRIQR
jgi:hypothetical protein